MNKNQYLSSNKHAPHTFSLNPPHNPSSKQNTLRALMRGQITGKSYTSVRQLNPGFFSHMNKSFNAFASQIVELEDSMTLRDGAKCNTCLIGISRKLSELTNAFHSEHRDWFVQLHGVELVVRCLEFPPPTNQRSQSRRPLPFSSYSYSNSPSPSASSSSSSPFSNGPDHNSWKARNQCMALLRELSFSQFNVGETLSQNDHLITFLFSLLSDSRTFDGAIGLLEEILSAREDTFDLTRIPNFNALVKGMSKAHLGIFCRVLAMVVYEPDDRHGDEVVSSLELLRSRKRGRCVTPATRNIDKNHAIVMGIPNLLERLVKLLAGTNHPDSSLSRFPSVSDLLTLHYFQSGRNAIDDEDEDEEDEGEEEEEEGEADEMEYAEGEEEEEDEEGENGEEEMEEGDAMEVGDTAVATGGAERVAEGDRAIANMNGNLQGLMAGIAEGLGLNGLENILGGGDRMLYNMDQELEAFMNGTAQNLKDLALSTYQVELLFVLYALLAGKRKAELQDKLASLGLIHTATLLFDKTDWLKPPPALPPHHHHHHGNNGNNNTQQHTYECHPDAALKIQLLRLILNFCDGDFESKHKRLLLSKEELATLHLTQPTPGVTYDVHPNHSNAKLCATSGPGLLTKLINVFYKLPQEQTNRFWMASCIEAFLRGSEPVFQKFVEKTGMLPYLLGEIVSDATKVPGSLQTSFDLLGELMKFNREIFISFTDLLVGDNASKFFHNVMAHLVDSNVFLRGMVLSIEKFKEEDAREINNSSHTPYPFATCKISKFLDQNWYKLVKDLMTVVSIEAINQENICCVNTTMVFCIYARRKGQLQAFVKSTKEEEEACIRNLGPTAVKPNVTSNFQKLLWFWHEYYLLRGKDSLSLEYTSQIPFSEWTKTYEVLVEDIGLFDPTEMYEAWQKYKKE